MNSQVYQDQVQPGEKAPAHVEHTTDALKSPPQPTKSKPYKVLFTIGSVIMVVAFLTFLFGISSPMSGETNFAYLVLLPLVAIVMGATLCIAGLLNYRTEKKSS